MILIGVGIKITTPSGFACPPSNEGEFWAGYSPPLEGCPKGEVHPQVKTKTR